MPSLRQPRPLTPAWDETRGGHHAAAVMAMLGLSALPAAHGNCYDTDPEVFFADGRDTAVVARAKAICAGCPIQRACLTLGQGQDGIWGGATRAERARPATALVAA